MPGDKKKAIKKAINRDFNRMPTDVDKARGKRMFAKSFNDQFPIGAEVWYVATLPDGAKKATTIRGEAFVTESGHAVCFVNGVSGFVLCDHIMQREPS